MSEEVPKTNFYSIRKTSCKPLQPLQALTGHILIEINKLVKHWLNHLVAS